MPAADAACVSAASPDQLVVRAILDQTATIDGDDAIRHPQRGEPMRDDEDRSSASNLRHILLNDALALVVERACRLVENEDAWVGNQRAGDGDPLPLAARQAAAPLADDCVIALGQFENEVVGACECRGGDDALGRRGRIGATRCCPGPSG